MEDLCYIRVCTRERYAVITKEVPMRTCSKIAIAFIALFAMLTLSCATTEEKSVSVTETTAGATSVTVYERGNSKLHVLASNDALGDVSFIVEGEEGVVGIELPAFTQGLEEWKGYVAKLGKPMDNIFIADHATGESYVSGMNVLGSAGAAESITSGATFATTDGLYQTFGDDFHGGDELVRITEIVQAGVVEISGMKFTLIDRGYTYDLEIPLFDAIYTHMLGKYTHSIITSAAYIDEYKAVLEEYQRAGYKLILSAHSGVEGQDAVSEKLAYLENIRKLYEENSTAEEFIAAAMALYPDYSGVNYLEMSAGYLYN